MDEATVIKYLKRGEHISTIRKELLKEYCPGWNYKHSLPSDAQPEFWLSELKSLGFNEANVTTTDNKWYSYVKTTWLLTKGEFKVEFNWEVSGKKKKELWYYIRFLTPLEDYITIGNPNKTLAEEIAAIISRWPKFAAEWKGIEEHIPKLMKRLDVGESTIDAVIKALLQGHDWTYNVFKQNRDTYLRIKMTHHRCIEIKLLPTMNMAKLATLATMIDSVTKALATVGSVNLTVRNYGNDIDWQNTENSNRG